MNKTSGQIGYEAYRSHTGGISIISGQPIPEWSALRTEIREAWEAAASAIAGKPGSYDSNGQPW